MDSKKWLFAAVLSAVTACLLIVLINVFTDPFGVFGDEWYSYNETNNPRVAKIEYLKKNHDKYDSYIIGCSSTSSYPVEELNRYMGAKFYNMIMYGADMLDTEQTARYLIENYTVKNLVINIYIANGLDYDYEPDKMTGSMHPDVTGESGLSYYARYAFANPAYSMAKIKARHLDRYLSESFDVFDEETGAYDKRKRDAEHISDLDSYYEDYPVFADYPAWEVPLSVFDENAESLKRIKELCDQNGIRLIVLNAPIYYDYFKCIPRADIERFYSAISDSVEFWDFSVSSVSLEPRYFYDETHFRNDVGRMALARVFGDDSIYIPEDFGKLVTKKNVKKHIDGFYGLEFSDKAYTVRIPVLLYHNLAEAAENEMTVSFDTFRSHMKKIADDGFSAVTADDLYNYIKYGKDLPEKPVLITFDDGYMSNFKAYPILEKYGLKATIFAVGETFSKNTYPGTDKEIFPHFGKKEMEEMENSGVIDIESHTFGMHQSPDYEPDTAYENILITDGESDSDYVLRIKSDFDAWKKAVGKTPSALAFPHGISDLFSQEVLNECGILLTFSTEAKTDTLIKGLSSSGYNIGRYTVTEDMTPEDISELIK